VSGTLVSERSLRDGVRREKRTKRDRMTDERDQRRDVDTRAFR
jgi:hypothetical protein